MDTIYSQRTGATPLASSQPTPSNPMVNAPATRFNAQAIQDYLRANQAKLPQGNVQYPQGIDLQTLVNNAQQDNQAITRPDYDINPPAQPQQGGINIDQLLGQIASGGSLSGIDAGAPQPTNAGPEAFANEQTMADNGLLPTSAPKEISQNPTNDTKQYSQGAVNKGLQSVDIGMSSQNPNSAMSAETQNLDASRIKGDMVNVAQARDPKAAWQDLKKDPFYKDSNFYTGMMNVGLAIMSGANPMQAFQAGSQAMASADMKSQLRDNRDYLLQQYTPDSVAAAISSGDPKMLKQREMSDADKAAMQNNEWTRRNSITSAQDDARADRTTQLSQAAEDRRYAQQDKLQQQRFDQQKELFGIKQDVKNKAAQAAANSLDFTSRDLNSEKNTPDGKVVTAWAVKNGYFTAAKKDLALAREAIQRGDYQAATAAYQQGAFNAARGEIGENRSLQEADVTGFAEDPSIFVKGPNKLSLKAGWHPTLSAISYLEKANDVGSKSAETNLNNTKNARIQNLSRTMGAKKATALVNRAFGGGWNDPLDAFAEEGNAEVNKRTGGALSDDTSWLYK